MAGFSMQRHIPIATSKKLIIMGFLSQLPGKPHLKTKQLGLVLWLNQPPSPPLPLPNDVCTTYTIVLMDARNIAHSNNYF